MPPNPWLLASGTLVLALGVFHSLLGEVYLVRRLLRRDDLPKLFGSDAFTKLTIRYAWHVLSLFCLAATALLYAVATGPLAWGVEGHPGRVADARTLVIVLGALFVACAAWGLIATRGRHLSWAVFLGAAVTAFAGAWPQSP